MQNYKKCYENVWILSGTSDGPPIVKRLLKLKYSVTVSVVSYKASTVYPLNQRLSIVTGRLNDVQEFKDFIILNNIDYVIDATHPFATNVSEKLYQACLQLSKPIFRFERNYLKDSFNSKCEYINDLNGVDGSLVRNKNLLLAIGSKYLENTAQHYLDLGANLFARIISTPESISKAFSSGIKNSNIAILNPTKNEGYILEMYLCKYWNIDYVLCRDSGGYSQMIWRKVSLKTNVRFFLLKRPKIYRNTFVFSKYDLLVKEITNFKNKYENEKDINYQHH